MLTRRDDYIELLKRQAANLSFWRYCLYHDYEFFSRRPFLQEVADALQWVYEEYLQGRARKVSVSMPPRAGKSYILSLFCAWWLGKLPELSVMRNTCTATLYDKFSYDVRNIVKSVKYKAVFQTVKLASDKQNLDGWNLTTSKQVGYFGAGVGGTIIGFGANLALSDDLYRGLEDALSPGYNDKVHRWKESAHDSRKEKNCSEIFIGTRWLKNDVIGKAQEEKKIDKQITIAALNEKNESFCEEVKTTAEYREIKSSIDESIWEAEYMQSPIDIKGLLFPKSQLNFYDPETFDVEKHTEYSMCAIDPAGSGDDDLSGPNGRLIGNRIYIHDVIYNKYGTEYNEPHCVEFIKKNKCESVEFEGNAAWDMMGIAIRNKLGDDGSDCDLTIYHSSTNKHVRIFAQSAFIKHHMWFRSDWEIIPEYRRFMKCLMEYMALGKGASTQHDDAPDSLAVVAKFFKLNFPDLWKVITQEDKEAA